MIVKESAVSQKNNLMNKILLFLLGGCIIGSAITIFSAQNKHKKIPTQQNAESKQNTQQEDRISTISPNILLGMSKLEYNSLIKQYKNSGKMSIWDNNTYCMHWFETQNITVHDNSVGNFTSTQSFSIIFDIQPKFVNNKLHTLSMLIEPLYDDTILVQTSNIILLKNHKFISLDIFNIYSQFISRKNQKQVLRKTLYILSTNYNKIDFLIMALINCPECGNSISDQASHCPKCGYQISNHSFFPKTEGCFLQSMNMGCLILVIIFLFSIILSEYDIPEEDLPIIGIITIIVFGIMICYNFFKKKKQNQ